MSTTISLRNSLGTSPLTTACLTSTTFQADVAHEGFMRGQYDVCVGLAAYSYMQKNIDYICRQVRDLMIIETHEVRASAGMPGTFSGSSRTLLTGTAASTAPSCSLAEAGELLDRLALGG
jgi:hypothetical protein